MDASVVSTGVGSTTSNFVPGAVSGAAPWFLSETSENTSMNPTVEMSWECATPTEQEETQAPLGFMFKPSDLGCQASWLQRYVLRPEPTFAPTSLRIQPYGNATLNRQIRVSELVNGTRAFRSKVDGFEVVGTRDDIDANLGMVLNIELLRFRGVQVCQPGTYTIPAEE
jgi:hypothetical protein